MKMKMAQHLFTIATALLTARLAQAARVSHILVTDIDGEPWNTAFNTPNATGEVSFQGLDLSQPYPGEPSGDWKWTIQVRDNVPRPNGLFTTGTWIQLQVAPSSISQNSTSDNSTGDGQQVGPVVAADPSWAVCMTSWQIPGFLTDDDPEDPGRCNGILPDDCISALMSQLSGGFNLRSNGEADCPSAAMPSACDEALKDLDPPDVGAVGFRMSPRFAFSYPPPKKKD